MNDAPDKMMNYALQIGETVIKLSGQAAVKLLAMFVALLKDNPKLTGATRIVRMLRENKPLEVFQMPENRLKEFAAVAKKYGILYTVIKDKSGRDGIIDLVVRAEDAAKVNRALEKAGAVDLGTVNASMEDVALEMQNPTKGRNQDIPSGNLSKTKENVVIIPDDKAESMANRKSVREKMNELKSTMPPKKKAMDRSKTVTRAKAPKLKVK